MGVIANPSARPTLHIGWPAGGRIRYGAVKAKWLRLRKGRRARLVVSVLTVVGPHQAVVTGLTLYGAILRGGRKLRRRELIALRLPSGWRVKGRVKWRFGSRCGIAFLTPVADFARLLCEGAAIRRPTQRKKVPVAVVARISFPASGQWSLAAGEDLGDRLLRIDAWAKALADRVAGWAGPQRTGRDRSPS